VVERPVAQGRYAARFEVRRGDRWRDSTGDRAELARDLGDREGVVRRYSWWTMFDRRYPYDATHGWQIFTQWHSTRPGRVQPMVYLYASGDEIGLKTVESDAEGRPRPSVTRWRGPMRRGVWQRFAVQVRWSADAAQGQVTLWVDGRRVAAVRHVRTLVPGYGAFLKQGLYRSDRIVPPAVVFHDGLVARLERAATSR
jgi:Polysaccharide lyase